MRFSVSELNRKINGFEQPLGGGRSVFMRKLDIVAKMFAGEMPTTMLGAIVNLEKVFERAANEKVSPIQLIADMTERERADLLEMMRAFAVLAVIDPPLTSDPVGDETHASVHAFAVDELVRIFTAEPPAHVAPSSPDNPPVMSRDEVRSFRPSETVDDDPAVPNGVQVPDATFSLVDDGLAEVKAG